MRKQGTKRTSKRLPEIRRWKASAQKPCVKKGRERVRERAVERDECLRSRGHSRARLTFSGFSLRLRALIFLAGRRKGTPKRSSLSELRISKLEAKQIRTAVPGLGRLLAEQAAPKPVWEQQPSERKKKKYFLYYIFCWSRFTLSFSFVACVPRMFVQCSVFHTWRMKENRDDISKECPIIVFVEAKGRRWGSRRIIIKPI